MAPRHTKILLGPTRKNDPQVAEHKVAAANFLPGQLVVINNNLFELAVAASTGRVFLLQEHYLAMKGVDVPYRYSAAADGITDTAIGLEMEDDVIYAARVATGQDVKKGAALALGPGGNLIVAGAGARVVAHAHETFNNTTGAPALVAVRKA